MNDWISLIIEKIKRKQYPANSGISEISIAMDNLKYVKNPEYVYAIQYNKIDNKEKLYILNGIVDTIRILTDDFKKVGTKLYIWELDLIHTDSQFFHDTLEDGEYIVIENNHMYICSEQDFNAKYKKV